MPRFKSAANARSKALNPGGDGIQIALRAALVLVSLLMLAALALHIRRQAAIAAADATALTIVMRAAPNLADAGSVDDLADRLASANVEHVLLQFKQDESDEFVGGEVFFPSRIATVAAGYEDDRIGRLLASLNSRNIRVSAWMPTLHDPSAALQHPEWRAWWMPDATAREDQQLWLCPSADQAIAYEASIAAEIMDRYPTLAGLYIDFIRYDSDFSCVCDRCLREFDGRIGWSQQHGRPLTATDVGRAGQQQTSMWHDWIAMRAERVCAAVDAIRDRVEEVREDCHIGACVLPFSAADYTFNTQSGQDLYEMARAGLDEIVLMGYWDDWQKKPEWLRHCIDQARQLVEGECALSCLIDADMPPRRTLLTLDAVNASGDALDEGFIGFFQYQSWDELTLAHVGGAIRDCDDPSLLLASPHTSVVIRIDTEPDDQHSYENTNPGMVRTIMDMLEAEGVRGTFVTCARLAERQPEIIREAEWRGHEIANHAYDHEQLDALSDDEQMAVIDHSVQTFKDLGVQCVGFGAPRNSVTQAVRARLLQHGFRYDGSDAYDPIEALVDPYYVTDEDEGRRLLVIPFVWPNDWDARRVLNVSAEQMFDMWKQRLAAVIEMGEPCFVLDIHQWLASQPENLAAVQSFIRHARSLSVVRVETLAEAAVHIDAYLAQFDEERASIRQESTR